MEMTVEEIKRSYREAKHKKRQIRILADLNCCRVEEIEEMINPSDNLKLAAVNPAEEISVSLVKNTLFCRLDRLDRQIRVLEREYRETLIALSMIGRIEEASE
ncbi:MAG: hypothetical protein ACI4TA_13690 [Acetatifactor sp.]